MKRPWNVESLQLFTGHRQSIYAMAPDPEQGRIYSSGADGLVVAWSPAAGEKGILLAKIPEAVFAILPWRKDILLAGTASGDIYLIRLEGNPGAQKIKAHHGAVFALADKGNGEGWYSGGKDGHLKEWDAQGHSILNNKCSRSSIRAITVAGTKLAAGSSDWQIRQWEPFSEGEPLSIQNAHEQSVFSVLYSKDGNLLYSGGRDAALKLWDSSNGLKQIREVPAHWSHVNHLSLSPDERLLASASMDKSIRIWDAASLELLKVIDASKTDAHQSSVNKVFWLDHERLVSAADDRTVRIFRIFQSD